MGREGLVDVGIPNLPTIAPCEFVMLTYISFDLAPAITASLLLTLTPNSNSANEPIIVSSR